MLQHITVLFILENGAYTVTWEIQCGWIPYIGYAATFSIKHDIDFAVIIAEKSIYFIIAKIMCTCYGLIGIKKWYIKRILYSRTNLS